MEPKIVVEFLTETLRTHGPMLGAPLGGLLSKAFPALKGSPGYTNLRSFIERHCEGLIVRVDWNGSDYRFELAGEESRPSTPDNPPFAAWGAFLKADLPMQVAVDTNTGELRTIGSAELVDEPWRAVAKLSAAENREIAELFLPELEEEDRPTFSAALKAADYWPEWSRLVNQTLASKYKQSWARHRFARICERFQSRMRETGLDEETTARALRNLQAEKERHSIAVKSATAARAASLMGNESDRNLVKQNAVGDDIEANELRRVAQRVVGTLSEDELRRLWLPLGEVIHALRQVRL